jgi:hypothetical protein
MFLFPQSWSTTDYLGFRMRMSLEKSGPLSASFAAELMRERVFLSRAGSHWSGADHGGGCDFPDAVFRDIGLIGFYGFGNF